MTAEMIRAEIAHIEYCIAIRNEDITKLNESKAHLLALLKNEGRSDCKCGTNSR